MALHGLACDCLTRHCDYNMAQARRVMRHFAHWQLQPVRTCAATNFDLIPVAVFQLQARPRATVVTSAARAQVWHRPRLDALDLEVGRAQVLACIIVREVSCSTSQDALSRHRSGAASEPALRLAPDAPQVDRGP